MDGSEIAGLILVIVVSLFIIAVLVYLFAFEPGVITLPSQFLPIYNPIKPLPQGYACSQDSDCENKLVCDPAINQCKIADGDVCKVGHQCLVNSYCSGICYSIEPNYITEVVGDPCPCASDFGCIESPDGNNLQCLKLPGVSCGSGSECLSNLCLSGTCQDTAPNGSSCLVNGNCSSNNCQGATGDSEGICQPYGIENGEQGASCNSEFGCDVNQGLNCSTSGICTDRSSNLQEICGSAGLDCTNNFKCYQIPITQGDSSGTTYAANLALCGSVADNNLQNYQEFCQCLTPYVLTPNSVGGPYSTPNTADGIVCREGYSSPPGSGFCLAPNNDPAFSSSTCISGKLQTNGSNNIGSVYLMYPNVDIWEQVSEEAGDVISGTELTYFTRSYPVNGLYGSPFTEFRAQVELISNQVLRLAGYSINYETRVNGNTAPTIDLMLSWENIFALFNDGKLYRYNSNSFIPLNITSPDYSFSQILDVDIVYVSNIVYIIIGAEVSPLSSPDLTEYIIFRVDVNTLIATPYGTQPPSGTTVINRISVAENKNSNGIDLLYVVNNSNVYVNGSLINLNNHLCSSSTPDYNTLTITNQIGGVNNGKDVYYTFIMYLENTGPTSPSYVRYTKALSGNPSLNYCSVSLPSSSYSTNAIGYKTYGFGIPNNIFATLGYQNTIMLAGVITGAGTVSASSIYYYNNSSVQTTPGYLANNCKFLMTQQFLYVYNPYTCA